MRTLFGSPKKVVFCKECTMSNQRPATTLEYEHNFSRSGSKYLHIHEDGICDACKYCKSKYGKNLYILESLGLSIEINCPDPLRYIRM